MNKTENLENHFVQVLRRWWWLIVLVPLLTSAVSYFLNKSKPTLYEAEAQMMVGPGLDNSNPDLNSLRASGFLMQTYKKMASTEPFLQAVLKDLKVDLPLNQLNDMITVNTDPNSLILTIDAQSQDPGLAVLTANAVAKELLIMSPANPNNPATISLEQNRAQANSLDDAIKQSQSKLSSLETELQALDAQTNPAADSQSQTLDATNNRINYLESEYQKLTNVAAQSQMGTQILNELIVYSQARLTYLQSQLQKTEPDLQNLVLPQIDAENSHLADVQKTLLENQQTFEGQTLDGYIQTIQANIAYYQSRIPAYYDVNNRRLLSDQISTERNRLTNAENIVADQRVQVFSRLSEEHSRLSDLKNLPISEKIQKRSLLTDQITTESDRLTTLQDSRATLSDTILKSWTNEVQITQLASTATNVPSNLQLFVLLAFIAGLAAAMAVVLANVYFDSSVQNAREMEAAFGAPVLGRIQPGSPIRFFPPTEADQLAIQDGVVSESEENYRMMVVKALYRLNSFHAANKEAESSRKAKPIQENGSTDTRSPLSQTIMISDVYSETNISEIAAKMAMAFAQTGKRVLLVDSTLTEFDINQIFGEDTTNGLSISLTSQATPVGLLAVPSIENLFILPGGPIHSGPFGLFGPAPASEVLRILKKFATYVLVVGPHLLTSSATFGFASRVDGLVLVVPDSGLNGEQLNSLRHNVNTYKWQIIGSVAVKKETRLQSILTRWLNYSRNWGIHKNGPLLIQNPKSPFSFGILGNPQGNKQPGLTNEGAFQETNHIEGESL